MINSSPVKILICGLPGSGKTTLAQLLHDKWKCVWWNADEVRREINKDLGFSVEHRIEQARRLGILCDISLRSHTKVAIADFVCPLPETRKAFNPTHIIYMDTIVRGRYADTNNLFVPPQHTSLRLTSFSDVRKAFDAGLFEKLPPVTRLD